MKAYPYDLRQRILRAVDQGRPRKEIVSMFGVLLATIKRYLKQRRETGDVQAKPIPGRPAKIGFAFLHVPLSESISSLQKERKLS
jgi:transposase